MAYGSQDTYGGSAFSRVLSREQRMAWTRYKNDTLMATETFPATGLIDSFNRADGPLAVPPYGSVAYYGWTGASKMKVQSNLLVPDTATGDFAGTYSDFWYQTTFGPDMEAYITISSLGAGNEWYEFTLRAQDPGSSGYTGVAFYFAKGDWTGSGPSINGVGVKMNINGVNNVMAYANNVFTPAAGDSIGARVVGKIMTFWHKPSAGSWTKIFSYATDYLADTPGKIFFYNENTTSSFNDFGGGEIFDARKYEGIQFNVPAAVEPGTEWAHPFFEKVRSYSPNLFITNREAKLGGSFTLADYKVSSPSAGITIGANSYVNVIDGPIAGYKGIYFPAEDSGNKFDTASITLPTSQITVGTWVKSHYPYNWLNLMNHEWTAVGAWLLYASDTYYLFGIIDSLSAQKNAGFLVSAAGGFDSKWHFVVGTYDGATVKIYVDGVLGDGATGFTASTVSTLDGSGVVNLHGGPSRAMGPAFILPTALNDAQVMDLHQTALAMPLVGDQMDMYKITSVSGWDKTEVRDSRTDLPGNHGEVVLRGNLGGRNITINGQIRASNLARLRYMEARLKEECACVMEADVAMTNMFWRNSAGTLTVYDPDMNEPVQIPGRVVDLKIEEQQKTMLPHRDFQLTVRSEMPHHGVHGAVQVDSTVNLINGATIFSGAVPGNPIGSYGVDSLIRIGNYPTGAATAAISGSLTISSSFGVGNDQIVLTNPVWPPNEWWEIDSRECSVKAYGLSASAYNKFSFVDMTLTTQHFLRVSCATITLGRSGTVTAGTPKVAVFRPDNPFL